MGVDVCIIAYDPTRPQSLENLERMWIPELLLNVPTKAWLFVPTMVEERQIYQQTFYLFEKVRDSSIPSSEIWI
jgi:GTPase SAR1 family protein